MKFVVFSPNLDDRLLIPLTLFFAIVSLVGMRANSQSAVIRGCFGIMTPWLRRSLGVRVGIMAIAGPKHIACWT